MNTQSTIVCSILYLVFISWLNAKPIVKIPQGLLNGTKVSKGGGHFSAFIGIPFAQRPIGPLRSWSNAEPIVQIRQGYLKGTKFESRGGRHFSAFMGIPFAQSPTGPLCFSNPVPSLPWHGIRSANEEANMCPQQSNTGKIIGNEDCLYLNVYSPVLNFSSSLVNNTFTGTLLPVMVWIHGGGFYWGSGGPSQYSPNYLMDKDIVFVSMNYRLGILGFLSTGDSVAPGNFGLKDQVLGLKWVQENIQVFGGDKNRVTLFGQSAGGVSVNYHAISDASNGLFQQYIIQSGSVLGPWAYRERSQFKPYVNKVAKNVGCSTIDSNDLINCLRETSVDKLLNALIFQIIDFPALHWIPTDEPKSKEAFLTDSPKRLVEQCKMKNYPAISGNVLDEGMLVTSQFYINSASELTSLAFDKIINLTATHYLIPQDIKRFREIVEDYYFKETIISSHPDKLLKSLTEFIGDSGFLYPQISLVEKLVKVSKNPVYFYSFNYRGNTNLLTFLENIQKTVGVPHGDELLYIFSIVPSSSVTKKDESVIDLMVDLWTSFAINGKPTSKHLADSNLWQPYQQSRSFLEIGNMSNNSNPSVTLQRDFFTDRMNLWRKHFPLV